MAPAASAQPKVTLRIEPPAAWPSAPLAPPDLSETPQVTLVEWRAWGPDRLPNVRFVVGCFASEVTTWAEEADDIALDKLAQIASSTALRVAGLGAFTRTARAKTTLVTTARLEGTGDSRGVLSATTVLGFTAGQAYGCFVLCVDPTQTCRDSAFTAALDGPLTPPPAPNVAVRTLALLVHHPGAAGWGLVGLFVGAGALAVATRKRPR